MRVWSVKTRGLTLAAMSTVHYLEVVTNEVDATCALYGALWNMSFGEADAALGQARTATRPDGTVIGVRAPLADHEAPILRSYVAVDDIAAATKAAEANGAMIAYPPTAQGEHGTFAIVILDGVQHGLWQG